jgi:hypothetical protein|nr:MAG TPA: GENERAL CONTROL PROTEIN GCN4, VIMENTIN FILAMENT, COILED COIL, HEPTAD.9A [Caudoviricetes sp.]
MSRVEEIQKHISNTESKLASLRSELEKHKQKKEKLMLAIRLNLIKIVGC